MVQLSERLKGQVKRDLIKWVVNLNTCHQCHRGTAVLEPQLLAQEEQEKRHSFFIQRYQRLLSWALQITNQHCASSEDLVQDAFIQFVHGNTRIEEIDNLDGYLRRMLRYIHLAKKKRLDQKTLDSAVSLSDYNSLNLSWSNIDLARRLQVQEELWRVCVFACLRKETSRTGAVVILRFFHNYYPSEMARLLCVSRHSIDQSLNLARKELKHFLSANPATWRMVKSKKLGCGNSSPVTCYSLNDLRNIVFTFPNGECMSVADLQTIYRGEGLELSTARLAHLVSCRKCLDHTNQILSLPLLAERDLFDGERSLGQ